MAELTQSQRAKMESLFRDNGLEKEDVFTQKMGNGKVMYVIITRTGIEKIQYKNNIKAEFYPVTVEAKYACFKGVFTKGDEYIETFGSASPETSKSAYYAEMAEKRCLSRGVLKIMKLYEYGIFGEDEFKDLQNSK